MRCFAALAVHVAVALAASTAGADAPPVVSYQGLALAPDGTPLNGPQDVEVRIYEDPLTSDLVYHETHSGVEIVDGVFSTSIGEGTPVVGKLDSTTFEGVNRWLEIQIAGKVLAPRQKFTSVAYALQSATAGSIGLTPASDVVTTTNIESNFQTNVTQVLESQVPPEIARDAELSVEVMMLEADNAALEARVAALEQLLTGTQYYAVGPGDFIAEDTNNRVRTFAGNQHGVILWAVTNTRLMAGIHLPHGALMTRLTGYVNDVIAPADLRFRILRKIPASVSAGLVAQTTVEGSSGFMNGSASFSHVVDNQNWHYFLDVTPINGLWSTNTNLAVQFAVIEYTLWSEGPGLVGCRVDFYWDVGSTNTYFALHLIRPIVERHAAELVLHPFNLGYVFRHHSYSLADEPAAKLRNRFRDLERWAERHALPFRMPERFPIKTSHALRGAIAARAWDRESAYIDEIFSRYWERGDASIAEPAGVAAAAVAIGLDGDAFLKRCNADDTRQALIDSTQAGLERGVFGAPSFVIGDELFWGKDRMEFVEDEIAKSATPGAAS